MALYRCAACGSPNVVTDTQKEGYDYVKGAIGTAILGTGGAVAGVNGKTKRVYKCPDCGLTMNSPMPDEIKTLIDIGVMDVDARKRLSLRGTPMEWDFLKRKYKNIENGVADEIAASREAFKDELRNTKYSLEWQLEFDYASEEGKALLESLRPVFEAEYTRMMEEADEQVVAKKQQEKAKELERLQEFRNKQSRLNAELSSLGWFKNARKKEIQAELAKVEEFIQLQETIAGNADKVSSTDRIMAEYVAIVVAALKATGFALRGKQIEEIAKSYNVSCLNGSRAISCVGSSDIVGVATKRYEGNAKSTELYVVLE